MADLKEIIQRGSRFFNERNVDGLVDLYTDDAEASAPGGMVARGKAEIRKLTESWIKGFPDAEVHDHRLTAEGNVVIAEGTFRGTHTGPFATPMGEIPPTGRTVEGPYVDVFEFEGDKVKTDRLSFDRMQLMEQLGLVPTPAAAGASN